MIAELANSPPDHWVSHIWRYLRGRFEDEAAEGHAGVRQRQLRRVDHQVVVEQEIEIERSGRPAAFARAAGGGFDLLQHGVQLLRRQRRAEQGRPIKEFTLLGWSADRFCLSPAACGQHNDVWLTAQLRNGIIEIPLPVSEIRAESYECRRHGTIVTPAQRAGSPNCSRCSKTLTSGCRRNRADFLGGRAMKRIVLNSVIVAVTILVAIRLLIASEKEDAASIEQLRDAIAHRLPAGWTVTIDPGRPDRERGPGAQSLAIVIASNDELPLEVQMPNPAAGQPPTKEKRKVEIILAVRPLLTPEQFERLKAKDDQLVAARTAMERQLKKSTRWGYMGAEPIPPSAFDPKDDAQRRLVIEYALLWNRTEPEPLPTHYFENLSFDEVLPLYSAIADTAKSKEYEGIVKAVDGLLRPYEKLVR